MSRACDCGVYAALAGLFLLSVVSGQQNVPTWNTVELDPLVMPYGGAPLINGTNWTRLYFATTEVGQYAMSPMISYLDRTFLATWKVSPVNEDQAGQHIRFAQSTDGNTWINVSTNGTILDAPGLLFPPMNASQNPNVALFAEPTLYLNGHAYAAASPIQFCLYPDQYQDVLLLRRVFPGIGQFGPLFWASQTIPNLFEEASLRENVTTVLEQDAETQADIALLTPNQTVLPCDLTLSTKCEFCVGGCQPWPIAMNVSHMENERTHYNVPNSNASVLLYRNNNPKELFNHLFASYRPYVGAEWTVPVQTNISNDVANLNAGPLPDGRIFLITNIMPNVFRDPIYIALTEDGMHWTSVAALGTCWHPRFTNPGQPLGCVQRYNGGGIQGGLQYPQAIAVTDPAAQGYYVILSQNKEDIWVSKTPFSSFDY